MQCCTVIVPDKALDALMTVLVQRVPFGWEEESRPTGETCVRVYCENPDFMETLAHHVCAIPDVYMHLEEVDAVDWTLAWRDYFTPIVCGRRFVVLPPWLTNAPEAVGRTAIVIEPRSAFGTGHHATTALCLTALDELLETGRIRAGMRFLDLGTGSGILAIACCRAGLTGAAVDVDALALDNARENAALNSVHFDMCLGSLEAAPDGLFDSILANILAAPLRDMAADIVAKVRKGGVVVLSGILDTQADDVIVAYEQQGMGLVRRLVQDDWVALILER